jgi:hypothetical protein
LDHRFPWRVFAQKSLTDAAGRKLDSAGRHAFSRAATRAELKRL